MEIRKIKQLIAIFENSDLSELSLHENDQSLILKKSDPVVTTSHVTVPSQQTVAPVMQVEKKQEEKDKSQEGLEEIKSPLVGTFYAAPSPQEKPFVQKGSKVKQGDVVAIIEAMKVMNSIRCPFDGEIVETCVKNGDPIDYDQVLFRVKV